MQYYTFILHSKCSALIFLLTNHCRGLFLMELKKYRLSWQWGRIKSIKIKYLFILKECNLHSRSLCSPPSHFFQFLATFMDFLPLILHNSFIFFVFILANFSFFFHSSYFYFTFLSCIFQSSFLPPDLSHPFRRWGNVFCSHFKKYMTAVLPERDVQCLSI